MTLPKARHLVPTQKDIAKALGVAQSTVATALSAQHSSKLTPEIVAHIRAQAEKMGYRPQRFAQIMQGGRSRAVGLVTSGGGYNPSETSIHRLANALRQNGCHVVRADTEGFAGNPEAIRNFLLDHMVESVILCNASRILRGAFIEDFRQKGIPVLGFRAAFDDGLVAVRHDVRKAFYDMTQLHLALGSRKLCLLLTYRNPAILNEPPAWTNTERALGFYDAIREAGGEIVVDADAAAALLLPKGRKAAASKKGEGTIVGQILHPVETPLIQNMYELGYSRVQSMVKVGSLPDSLVCSNDDMAMGAMAACGDYGIRIPGDVRLSGCDDNMAGRFTSVPVATVRQPNDLMADYLTRIVSELMEDVSNTVEAGLYKFPCEIILRESIATVEEQNRLFCSSFPGVRDGTCFHRCEDRREQFLSVLDQ